MVFLLFVLAGFTSLCENVKITTSGAKARLVPAALRSDLKGPTPGCHWDPLLRRLPTASRPSRDRCRRGYRWDWVMGWHYTRRASECDIFSTSPGPASDQGVAAERCSPFLSCPQEVDL